MAGDVRVDELLLRYQECRQRGQLVAPEELCRDCPELLEEFRQRIGDLLASDSLLNTRRIAEADVSTSLPVPAAQSDESPPVDWSAGVRYQALRLHASGGLGEVYVAKDGELHREVALKRIQSPRANDPESRRRFLMEAEITGRLEHPGIVPVYGLVHDEQGHPCYAMRFIQGETLQQAIQRFHAERSPGSWGGLAFRQLLGRFISVCNTIGYAHSRGVLHRDLKPRNIMLGKYGETLVVDWGLAKAGIGGQSSGASSKEEEASASPLFQQRTTDNGPGDALTQTGISMGTPAFMSPEQATGQPEQIGPPSDIYGLGATLYVLLTGRPPLIVDQDWKVKVQRGEFLPPRQVSRDIPRPLEAVCLKAMALRPADRYQTPLQLAADLEHWLADEPVTAWSEPFSVRARRWVGRHRTLVTAVSAAAVVAATILAVATALLKSANTDLAASITRERQARDFAEIKAKEAREHSAEAETQRENATRQEKTANENFRLALATVNTYLTKASQDPRLRENDLEELRLHLLKAALPLFQKFVQQKPDDPDLQAEQGRAYMRLARITLEIASKKEAAALYEKALALFEQLVQAYPGVPEYQAELAATHNNLGNLHRGEDDVERAEASFLKALTIFDRLAREYPRVYEYRSHLARTHNNLAVIYQATKRSEQAEAAYDEARKLLEELARQDMSTYQHQADLAAIRFSLGNLYRATKRPDEAEAAYQNAVAILTKLALDHPNVLEIHADLAKNYSALATLHTAMRRPDQANAAFQGAQTIQEKLARRHPSVLQFSVDLAGTYYNRGLAARRDNQPEAAVEWFTRAIRTLEPVLQRYEAHPQARQLLRNAHVRRAGTLERLTNYAEAIQDWDRAIQLDDGREGDWLRLGRAIALARFGDHAKATTEAKVLADKEPASGMMLYDLACVYALASSHVRKDTALPQDQRERLAEKSAVQAIQLLKKTHTTGYFKNPRNREHLKKDPDLDSLRMRDEFKKLLAELEGENEAR